MEVFTISSIHTIGGWVSSDSSDPSNLHMTTPIHPSSLAWSHLLSPYLSYDPTEARLVYSTIQEPGDWWPPSELHQQRHSTDETQGSGEHSFQGWYLRRNTSSKSGQNKFQGCPMEAKRFDLIYFQRSTQLHNYRRANRKLSQLWGKGVMMGPITQSACYTG